jgi:hypothetical protein
MARAALERREKTAGIYSGFDGEGRAGIFSDAGPE